MSKILPDYLLSKKIRDPDPTDGLDGLKEYYREQEKN